MGMNSNINQFYPAGQMTPYMYSAQTQYPVPYYQAQQTQQVQPVIYNVPAQSAFANQQPASGVSSQISSLLKSYAASKGINLENVQSGNVINKANDSSQISSLLKSYAASKGVNLDGVQSVSMIDKTSVTEWKNNLKDNLRNSKSVFMAVIPRTMNAKDTDGNGLIQGNEIRGNFINAVDRLDELKALGINTLHVLPINPTSKEKAMGIAGSLYAPSDLLKVDPNLKDPNTPGTAEDHCKYFINECHKRGISVMLDLPSCVGLDFAKKHPELMAFEKDGSDKTPGGWQDIRMFETYKDKATGELNPHLLELHKKFVDMTQDLGFDGIRADVGRAKPAKFWDIIINYSRAKDPDFGWLAENYTYEDASPQLNMPHDRPIELMKAGFDAYYGQYHIFNQWTKASQLKNYVNEQIDMQTQFEDKQPRTLIGSFTTHDDQSPMLYGGSPWVQFTTILQSGLPLCNPYNVDGMQSGDYYLYPYEHAYVKDTQTDNHECTVHKGRIDIFNPSRKPGGKNPEIGKQMANMFNKRNNNYSDVVTKGSYCWIDAAPNNDEIICFARQYGNKTLLWVGNRNLNKRNSASIKLQDMKSGAQIKDISLPYGEKSYVQPKNGELAVDLGPSRMHVFEIDAPNIENDASEVSKFVNGVFTRVK